MIKLNSSDRIMHEQVQSVVTASALREGVADAAKTYGLQLTASVITAKVLDKKQECVKISTNNKDLHELYVAQTNMGVITFIDMFYAGGSEKLNMLKAVGFGALAGGVLGRRGSFVGGAVIPGLIGNHYGKKMARDNTKSGDLLEVLMQYVIPHAFEYALNVSNKQIAGAGGQKALPDASPEVVYEVPDTSSNREAEERARQQAKKAERQRQAAEAERQRQAAEKAAAEKAKADRAAAEAERQRQAAAEAERQRKAAEKAAAEKAKEAERQRQEAEERARRAEQERKARIESARTSESNSLNKLVYISREEARTGCVKDIEVEKGRTVSATIPAGTTCDSHVEIPGAGRLDTEYGVRGILRLSFAFLD